MLDEEAQSGGKVATPIGRGLCLNKKTRDLSAAASSIRSPIRP